MKTNHVIQRPDGSFGAAYPENPIFVLNHECLRTGEPRNVIFLDIDGVLNSFRSMSLGEMVDMECVRNVRRISLHGKADIVVSSTWRIGANTHQLREILFPLGLHRVIGRTASNLDGACRGDEIAAWIKQFGCPNYVILDDDRDMLESQADNFINTDGHVGITEQQSTEAIRRVFGINTPFCPECNGYGRTSEYVKCGSCTAAFKV